MSRARARVVVCAGGGGVGKTTSSAALGLALARLGARTLVVTIDPARRLADALGVELGNEVQVVRVDDRTDDRLMALMPDPVRATRLFMEYLFVGKPEALERMVRNNIFLTLEDKLAGMSELVAMTLVIRALEEQEIDVVIVDTAPSRYALDFLTFPTRLSELLDGRAVRWLASLADHAGDKKRSRFGVLGWGKRRVEKAIGWVLGESLLGDLAGFFAEISLVRKRFAALAAELDRILTGRRSRYVLVAAPTGAARADVEFLLARLERMGQTAAAVVLNRSELTDAKWMTLLSKSEERITDALAEALSKLAAERRARVTAATTFGARLARVHPRLHQVRLPLVEAIAPIDIVRALSEHFEPHITGLTGFVPVKPTVDLPSGVQRPPEPPSSVDS